MENADNELKRILELTVKNAVSRIEILKSAHDRRCMFHEFKEWLGKDINDEVWAMPSNIPRGGRLD